MIENWPLSRTQTLLIGLGLLVVVAVVIALNTGQDGEEAEPAAEAQATESPTVAPTAPPEPTPEPVEESVPTAAPAAAEEPAPAVTELEEFVSMTEFFTVQVPAGWNATEAVPGADLVLANSEAALDRYQSGDAAASGDRVINVGFIPYRLLQTNELGALDFQYDAPPDVFMQSLLPLFNLDDDVAAGEPQLVSLSEERDAALMTVSDEGREGVILMFAAGENVIALLSTVAPPGEGDDLQDLAHEIAAGVTFNIDHDTLYGAILRG